MHRIKLNKNAIRRLALYSVLGFVLGLVDLNHLEFMLVSFCFVSIFVIAKFSYYTVFSFILWFSFLQEYIASINPEKAGGRLMAGTGVPVYTLELYVCVMFFYILELFVFSFTDVVSLEREMYKNKIALNKSTALALTVLACFLVLLAYPSLPTLGASLQRDKGIVSSSLVVPLAVLILAITYDSSKRIILLKVINLIVIIWILFHGDRVIIMGYFVYIMLKYMNGDDAKFDSLKSIMLNRKTIILLIGVCAIVALGVRIQITREGGDYNLSFYDLLLAMFKQGTAGDVVFAFNCSVDVWKKGECVGLYPYIYYLSNLLPGANQKYYTAVILINKYDSLGGGLLFAEPMIAGGIIVVFIHITIFICLITWIISKRNKYFTFLSIPFYILIFRIAWYASGAALVKMVFYYIPFLYILISGINKKHYKED